MLSTEATAEGVKWKTKGKFREEVPDQVSLSSKFPTLSTCNWPEISWSSWPCFWPAFAAWVDEFDRLVKSEDQWKNQIEYTVAFRWIWYALWCVTGLLKIWFRQPLEFIVSSGFFLTTVEAWEGFLWCVVLLQLHQPCQQGWITGKCATIHKVDTYFWLICHIGLSRTEQDFWLLTEWW